MTLKITKLLIENPRERTIDDVYKWLKERDTETTQWLILGYDEADGDLIADSTGVTKSTALWMIENERLRILNR